jgi:hypothetical protein
VASFEDFEDWEAFEDYMNEAVEASIEDLDEKSCIRKVISYGCHSKTVGLSIVLTLIVDYDYKGKYASEIDLLTAKKCLDEIQWNFRSDLDWDKISGPYQTIWMIFEDMKSHEDPDVKHVFKENDRSFWGD